jgi:hypothetical protein
MIFRILNIFLIVISSGGIIFQLYGEYLTLLIFILTLLLFLTTKLRHVSRRLFASFVILSVLLIGYLLFTIIYFNDLEISFPFKLFIRFFFIGLLILYYYSIGFDKLKNDIYLVLKIILALSIINFIIINLFNGLFINVSNNQISANTILYVFNYISKMNVEGFDIYRNQGMFWEPGVLQVFLNILVYLSLYIYKEKDIFILATLTVLSTFSTAGIFILTIVILNFFLRKQKSSFLRKMIILLIILIPITIVLYINVMEKFYGSGIHSSGLRYLDFVFGLEVISNHPFLGIGFNPLKYKILVNSSILNFTDLSSSIVLDRGNTNSFISTAIFFGIPITLFVIYGLYSQRVFNEEKNLFFLIIFLTLISEPLILTNFFLLLMISSLVPKKRLIKL